MTPDLSKEELERLAILSEELGEVQQVIGKILRFGYASYNPETPHLPDNRGKLELELGDLRCIMKLMFQEEDIDEMIIDLNSISKEEKINKWMKYNKIKK